MMKRSILYFFFLLILITSSSSVTVQAQSDTEIEQVEVSLWSEYDRHAVLVIYRVQLADDTPLPAQIRLPMPVKAGEPFATAWMDEDGQLLTADYDSETLGEWNVVILTSKSLVAHLEYYLDYELINAERKFVFTWPEGFAVKNLTYKVQQPFAAEDLQVIPIPESSIIGNDGLEYHQADLGKVLANQSIQVELSYSNPSNQLTVDSMVTPEPLPISTPVEIEGGTPDLGQILPWILGGLGFILVVVGGMLYFQSHGKFVRVKKKSRPRSRAKPEKVEDQEGMDPSVIFCHQCGTKASVSDRFCRHCGVPLRR